MQQSLIAQYSTFIDSREPVILIMLEQGGFTAYTGSVTKSAGIAFLGNLIYGTTNDVDVNCGMDGINCDINILAYPYYPDLNYQLLSSYGQLSGPEIAEVEKTETVKVTPKTTEIPLKYPVHGIVSAEWKGDAYDRGLSPILPAPSIIVGDDYKSAATAIPCYGSVTIKYTTIVHNYVLDITPRPAPSLNPYSSVVFAVYDGGLVYLETEAPVSATKAIDEESCAYGDTVNDITDDEKPKKPDPEYADKIINVDYCLQKKIS